MLDWEEAVTGMVQNILSTPLDRANPDLVLSRISAQERLNEMEFNMPLDLLTSGKLRFILKSHLGKGFPKMTCGYVGQIRIFSGVWFHERFYRSGFLLPRSLLPD